MKQQGGVSYLLFFLAFSNSKLIMGAVSSEKGVLKLVHPGRYVEILREPITAAEVIKKNPRHSVTRPDVFEYPWIVVRPESLLNLGRVFYIVPNVTISDLLKVKGPANQSSRQNQSPLVKRTSPLKSYAGVTPKHQEHRKFIKQHPLRIMCLTAISPREKNYDMRVRKPSQVYSCWPDVIVKSKNTRLEFEEKYTSMTRWSRSFSAKDKFFTDSKTSKKFRGTEDDKIELEHSKEVARLKSCLRKEDSVRKSRNLRVSFFLPMNDDELQIKTTDSSSEFPGVLVC